MRMIFGMTLLTFVHVLLSLIGIGSGFVVLFGLLASRRLNGWTALFLVTTVLTSVTGFLFPFHKFLPSHGVGIVSLVVLAIAIFARYARQLAGGWRSEEHTSELQSRLHLVCRLLLEKKKHILFGRALRLAPTAQ